MADLQVKTANICDITSSTTLWPNAGGSGTYIADNSISVHMTNHRASGIYVNSLPERGIIGDKYTISFVPICTTDNVMFVVLHGTTTQISFTSGNRYTLTITATATDNLVAFYGANSVEKTVIIKDIQIEKGETATVYRPYSVTGWQHSLRKLTTATADIEPTIYTDGTPITSYTIKGNTVQDGTPTPSNPVDVNGVGERTENLLSLADVSTQTINGVEFSVNAQKGTVTVNGTAILNQDTAFNIPVNSALYGDFYVSGCPNGGSYQTYDIFVWDITTGARVKKWDGVSGMDSVLNANESSEIQIIQNHSIVVRVRVRYGVQFDNLEFKPMIRTPTAPSAFEPYGYKIPISNGGVTTNIYLGSTQTIRQIGKYIFNGRSTSFTTQRSAYRNNTALFATTAMSGAGIPNRPSLNNYFVVPSSGTNPQSLDYACSGFNPQYQFSDYYYLRVPYDVIGMTDSNTDAEFITAFNTWLSSLYNSGNPMIAYYALATPETAAVNEPLMKIGTYADTLSNAASIPTTEGANSITVDTTVQPSEFTATWTGWHDAEVKEWDGNDWQ